MRHTLCRVKGGWGIVRDTAGVLQDKRYGYTEFVGSNEGEQCEEFYLFEQRNGLRRSEKIADH